MSNRWKGLEPTRLPAGGAQALPSALDAQVKSSVVQWPKRRVPNPSARPDAPDLVVLSHLRWDFVFQRPQHLMTRAARQRRTYFVEEPIFVDAPQATMHVTPREGQLWVAQPQVPHGLSDAEVEAVQQVLLDDLFAEHGIDQFVLWYYTPMALAFTRHLQPLCVVYDCMDELSAFKNAPRTLRDREAELFAKADVVFTGGQSLFEAKRDHHPSVHAFPSSIDAAHFAAARSGLSDPEDQAPIGRPRIGFFGVVDERFDIDLVEGVARMRPDWQLVVIGPVVKIDPATLPKLENIHYLGGKGYKELPAYLSGWDIAMLPFARNESTRFISPTKTPEYLAAGKPVVSTSIRDVVRPYGQMGFVEIADTPEEFVSACERLLARGHSAEWLAEVDAFLAQTSWDKTWARMTHLMSSVVATKRVALEAAANRYERNASAGD